MQISFPWRRYIDNENLAHTENLIDNENLTHTENSIDNENIIDNADMRLIASWLHLLSSKMAATPHLPKTFSQI